MRKAFLPLAKPNKKTGQRPAIYKKGVFSRILSYAAAFIL